MSFWKTLGKIASIAAPIIAAPFTGGTSLALIGAGAGAAGGALSGGGVKGALLGAGLGAIPGLAGAGKVASSAAPLVGGVSSSLPAAITSQGVSQVVNPSIWSQIAQVGKGALTNPDVLKAGGAMLASGAQASASNRGTQIDTALVQERLRQEQENAYRDALLAREQDTRASSTDALRKLQQAEYIASAGGYTPPTISSRVTGQSRPLTSFGFGPKPTSSDERAGAGDLKMEVMKRLANRDSLLPPIAPPEPFSIDPSLLKGSIWEKLAGYGGAGLSAYGALTEPKAKKKTV